MEGKYGLKLKACRLRCQGLLKKKLSVTGTEGTTGVVIDMEGEKVRDGDEERVIAVEEIIVLDEEKRGVGEKEI